MLQISLLQRNKIIVIVLWLLKDKFDKIKTLEGELNETNKQNK